MCAVMSILPVPSMSRLARLYYCQTSTQRKFSLSMYFALPRGLLAGFEPVAPAIPFCTY